MARSTKSACSAGGHPGGVGVPEQDVERGWLLAQQVVVHPVVPDQVAGPKPGEHLGERPAVEIAAALGLCLRSGGEPAAGHGGRKAGARGVDHGDREGEGGEPLLPPGRGEIGRGHGRQDAAGTDPGQCGPLDAGDPLDRVHRVQDRPDVGVEVPRRMPRVRVAPRDHEHLLALTHEELDQAASGRQVQRVVLVDRRRHDQQRNLAHLLGLRGVLDQLEHLGAQHDRARCDGDVAADLERRSVNHLGDARRRCQVAQQLRTPTDQIRPGTVDRLLRGRWVYQWQVARGERLDQVLGRKRIRCSSRQPSPASPTSCSAVCPPAR